MTFCVNTSVLYIRVYKHQNGRPITHSALCGEAGADYKSRRRWA